MYNSYVFNEQFLGESEVEIPKGTEVVKDAIRKRKVGTTFIYYQIILASL